VTTKNLDRLFKPKSIAVIGASSHIDKVGNIVLRNLLDAGFQGPIYPINPKHTEIAGLRTCSALSDLPAPVDLAVICTPAHVIPQVVRECGESGILAVLILSAGFRELGSQGEELEQATLREAQRFPGLRIIGPNCLGIVSPSFKLNASFAGGMPKPGRVAFLSQSGALCTAILDWARQEGIGFSHFVSVGNMIDVGMGDLIDYFAQDDLTDSIIMYVESITKPLDFMSAARAFTRNKPIIAYKAGRFEESAKAAASHTGALAGVDAVYDAAFARAGIIRVFDVEEMFDCAELLARQRKPYGRRLAILTNAGGPGVMATDTLLEKHGTLASLTSETIEALNKFLPPSWSHRNPVDVLGDAPPERLSRALQLVLDDKQVDATLIIVTPQAMTNPTISAQAIRNVAAQSSKPILTSWMGGLSMQEGIKILNEADIPNFFTPEEAVRSFMHLVEYSQLRETLYEAPPENPVALLADRSSIRRDFEKLFCSGQTILSEISSKALLEAYGIPTTKTLYAKSKTDALECARELGYPVAMKILSPDITHKTDVGGVELNLDHSEDVANAFDRITGNANRMRPDARLLGVSVQRMVSSVNGRELIVGAKRDPVFGMVLLVGAGGTLAELFRDSALQIPPLTERLARQMIESLRCWPILQGYRGRPGVNIDLLINILIRVSYLVADFPEIEELDVNPLLVTPDETIAMDARIVLGKLLES
jgi:acetyltransferase